MIKLYLKNQTLSQWFKKLKMKKYLIMTMMSNHLKILMTV